jgi:hypothetical protein
MKDIEITYTFIVQLKKMRILTLFISLVILASCSATYKTEQTKTALFTSILNKEKVDSDWKVYSYQERNLRMSISNPRWRILNYNDEYDRNYSPYAYSYNYDYYYNPYYYPCPVYTLGSFTSSTPKTLERKKTNIKGYSDIVTNYKFLVTNITNSNPKKILYYAYKSDANDYNNSGSVDSRTWSPYHINNTNNAGLGRNNDGSGVNNGHSNGTADGSGIPQIKPGRGDQ